MSTRTRAQIVAVGFFVFSLLYRFLPGVINGNQDSILSVVFFIIMALLLVGGTSWVLFFKFDRKFLILGASFPFMVYLPYWVFAETLINTLIDFGGAIIATIIIEALASLFIYILILTINILNGNRVKDLPLGQAAKAAQFVIVLIGSYFFFTYIYGSSMNYLLRVIIVLVYISYLTLSSINTLNVADSKLKYSSAIITTVVTIAFITLSIWPVESIYLSLAMTILYYIAMNVALEVREQVTNYIWFEYGLLFSLIVVTFLTNAIWGVNGPIL